MHGKVGESMKRSWVLGKNQVGKTTTVVAMAALVIVVIATASIAIHFTPSDSTVVPGENTGSGVWWLLDAYNVIKYDENWQWSGENKSIEVGGAHGPFKAIELVDDYWYVSGCSYDKIYKFYENWDYTGTSYDIGSQARDVQGIHYDSSGNWWMVGGGSVWKYDSNWNYDNENHNLRSEDILPRDIWQDDDGNWWMIGSVSDQSHNYDSDWNHTETIYDLGVNTPLGLYKEGNYWWVSDDDKDRVYKYDENWNVMTYYDVSSELPHHCGIPYDIWLEQVDN